MLDKIGKSIRTVLQNRELQSNAHERILANAAAVVTTPIPTTSDQTHGRSNPGCYRTTQQAQRKVHSICTNDNETKCNTPATAHASTTFHECIRMPLHQQHEFHPMAPTAASLQGIPFAAFPLFPGNFGNFSVPLLLFAHQPYFAAAAARTNDYDYSKLDRRNHRTHSEANTHPGNNFGTMPLRFAGAAPPHHSHVATDGLGQNKATRNDAPYTKKQKGTNRYDVHNDGKMSRSDVAKARRANEALQYIPKRCSHGLPGTKTPLSPLQTPSSMSLDFHDHIAEDNVTTNPCKIHTQESDNVHETEDSDARSVQDRMQDPHLRDDRDFCQQSHGDTPITPFTPMSSEKHFVPYHAEEDHDDDDDDDESDSSCFYPHESEVTPVGARENHYGIDYDDS